MKMPVLTTLQGYKKENLPKDLLSGVVIAAVSIPISMGYAQIAGLPAVYGLYGSVLPVLLFALFSTSPQFIFGVDAAPAAMVGAILSSLGVTLGSEEAVSLVPVLTFYTALWLLLFAALRAGKVLNFISTPVMGGFISGICCTIILMQAPKLLGASAGTGELPELGRHLIAACGEIHWLSLALGLAALVILLAGKRLFPKFPMAIAIMVLGAVCSAVFDLPGRGVATLAAVEPGLPPLRLPDLRLLSPAQALGSTLPVAVVIMAETLLAENSFALRGDYTLRDNREILTFSLSNFAACLVGCCPVNGSVSRSSMNEQYGGRTQAVSLIAAAVMSCMLLLGTGFIQYLPIPVLTAIVISALMGATEFHIAHRLFRADRKEFYIFAGAFLGVLVLGTIYGVIIGVLLSFADVIHRASQPKRDFLGVIPGEPGFYPQGRMSQAQPIPGVVLYRFSGSLFFANIALFQQEIEDAVTPETRAVIVDASAIVSVDLSAADRLVVLHQKLARRGVHFYLTEHIGQVNDELRRYGADSLIESGAVRRTLLSALQDCGLWSGPMPRPEEELRRQTQEFEWAYGDEAEERMEQLAAQTLQTLEHTESADRPEQLEHLIHSGRWHGEIDRDAFISHLEEHIAELAVLLSRPEGSVLSQLDRERAHLSETLRREHPELAQRMAEHREELRRHLHARYPELADHIEDLRKKYENDQD